MKPLRRLLRRTLARIVLRRLLAWAACAILVLVPGGLLAGLLSDGSQMRLGGLLVVLSALPLFLLWPVPERRILERFRRLDEGMVFEAFLEAEPGPVRDLLRPLAHRHAQALGLAELPAEPWTKGLRGLGLAALAVLVLGQTFALFVLGRPLALVSEPPAAASGGKRIDEQGFSDFASEDPAARRARRERALERAEQGVSAGQGVGRSEALGRGAASSRRAPQPYDEPADQPGGADTSTTGPGEGAQEASAGDRNPPSPRTAPGSQGRGPEDRALAGPGAGPTPAGGAGSPNPVPGRAGQGYEHTGNTRVPSPLLDYRARFESRYAQRTGQRLAASGRMSLGELRAFQRRYFDSFSLRVDVGPGDDPYVALLKKRWADVKGGD